ncbi:hypothetical protein [Salisediminibacterium halotolerans]|uniref:hypothetical protein n=1 Tax=Salisediminibacterium halotolerans TaxID=517425 RepID=UPI00117184B2|nr:hypothetical protein [Salisediminibacterium halotolerans]GEL07742.1 hypothetical protein SHA02_11580 [Salisediminibacterium halotolerans]
MFFSFWRDSGYAFGALFAGLIADAVSVSWSIGAVAIIPFIAGVLSYVRMDETLPAKK